MKKLTIIYDGECPFCSNYVRLIKLREQINDIQIINARHSDDEIVRDMKQRGYNLDEGMIAQYDEEIYHGADAVHFLALQTGKRDFFNALNHWIFRSSGRARFLYPFLRAGRNLALKIKGVHQIHS